MIIQNVLEHVFRFKMHLANAAIRFRIIRGKLLQRCFCWGFVFRLWRRWIQIECFQCDNRLICDDVMVIIAPMRLFAFLRGFTFAEDWFLIFYWPILASCLDTFVHSIKFGSRFRWRWIYCSRLLLCLYQFLNWSEVLQAIPLKILHSFHQETTSKTKLNRIAKQKLRKLKEKKNNYQPTVIFLSAKKI